MITTDDYGKPKKVKLFECTADRSVFEKVVDWEKANLGRLLKIDFWLEGVPRHAL